MPVLLLLLQSMYYVGLLLFYLTITCLVFMLVGIWKPWIMLWWEDVQNRRKVIKVYGTIGIFFFAMYWLEKFIFE